MLFPEKDEDVLAAAMGNNKCDNIHHIIATIVKCVKEKNFEYTFYYDSNYFNEFTKVVELSDSGTYLQRVIKNIQVCMKVHMHDIRQSSLLEGNSVYVLWDSIQMQSVSDVHFLVKNAGEGASILDRSCLISFTENIPTIDTRLHVIKDKNPSIEPCPILFTIPIFRKSEEINAWLSIFENAFCLKNKSIFRVTSYLWPNSNQKIYQKYIDEYKEKLNGFSA